MTFELWHRADGEHLPEFEREVIALQRLKYGAYKVTFAHRPNPNRRSLIGETYYETQTFGSGEWNLPDIEYWLDVEFPEEIDDNDMKECDFQQQPMTDSLNCKNTAAFHVPEAKISETDTQNNTHLDTLKELLANMDVKAQDDHRAKLAEHEYWRKLRGDVYLALLSKQPYNEVDILDLTEEVISTLYNQDKEFFNGNAGEHDGQTGE